MAQKWRDKKTGKYYMEDDNGNLSEIPGIAPSDNSGSSLFRPDPNKESIIKAPTISDQIFNYGGKYVPPTLSAIGGILGAPAGIIGTTLGGAAGTSFGNALKSWRPDLFGEAPSMAQGIADTAIDAALNVGTEGLFNASKFLFPSGRSRIAQKFIKNQFPAEIDDITRKAIEADPNFKFTVGQVNPEAKSLEISSAPTARQEFINQQKKEIYDQASKLTHDTDKVTEIARSKIKGNIDRARKSRNEAYDFFHVAVESPTNARDVVREVPGKLTTIYDASGSPIQVRGPSTFEPIRVKGAIILDKSKDLARKIGSQLDDELRPANTNTANLTEGVASSLKTLRTEIDKIRGTQTFLDPTTHAPTNTLIEYDKLKSIQDAMSDFLRSKPPKGLRDRLEGSLNALRDLISVDIDKSIQDWGTESYRRFKAAKKSAQDFSDKYGNKLVRTFERADRDPEILLERPISAAMKYPKRTEQLIKATGSNLEAKKIFQTEIMDKAFDEATGKFNPQLALDLLSARRNVADKVMSSQARTNMERFLTRAKIIQPFSANADTALRMTEGGLELAMASAIGSVSGTVPKSLVGKGFSIILRKAGGRKFAQDVLMNPKNARIATGLLDIDPLSRTAKWGTRSLLSAMKGAQVYVRTPEGDEFPATITDSGKVRLDNQNQSQ